jgi:hypothetical protein
MRKHWQGSLRTKIIAWSFVSTAIILSAVAWFTFYSYQMTSFEEEELVQGVLAAGAISYLLKNVTSDELAAAIRAASLGKSTLSPEAAMVLVQATRPTEQPWLELTARCDLKDNHKLLGGWMRPTSFSFIVYADSLEASSKSFANWKGA